MLPRDQGDALDPVTSRTASRLELAKARRRRDRFFAGVAGLIALALTLSALAAWRLSTPRPPASGGAPPPAEALRQQAAEQKLVSSEPAVAQAPASSVSTRTLEASASAEIIIGWVGDTTPGSSYGNPPDKGRALFASTRTLLSEPDLMVANLEGTYGQGGPSKCEGQDASKCYAFQAPPAYAAALPWAGIDVVNLANNHSRDYLAQGLRQTKKALDDNEVAYTGLTDVVAYREVNGTTVAFIGFSPYSWSPSVGDLDSAQELVREASRNADIVVVLMHVGAEGADKMHTPKDPEYAFGEFRGNPRAFSHAVIDAGADLVLGSGPHVIRGMEEYRGRLIAYSLGNFAGWRNFSLTGRLALSGLISVRLAPDGRVLGGTWHSLKLAAPGVPKVDTEAESLQLVRELSKSDFENGVVPAEDGQFTLGTR